MVATDAPEAYPPSITRLITSPAPFVVLIVTAIMQVKYLNDALGLFSNSEVIPVHYVCFTLLSITGATVLYQEFSLEESGGGPPGCSNKMKKNDLKRCNCRHDCTQN